MPSVLNAYSLVSPMEDGSDEFVAEILPRAEKKRRPAVRGDKERVVHILNTHFPTNWSNENLRERVIEFGEDVWRQAVASTAAPELLEALKLSREIMANYGWPKSKLGREREVFEEVEQAIAKAEQK